MVVAKGRDVRDYVGGRRGWGFGSQRKQMVVVGFTKGREERLCGVAEGGGA